MHELSLGEWMRGDRGELGMYKINRSSELFPQKYEEES